MEPEKDTSFHLRLVLLVAVLPLIIACFGGWQIWRAESAVRESHARIDRIERAVTQIETAKRQAGKNVITLRFSDGTTMTSDKASRNLLNNKKRAEKSRFWQRTVCLPFACGASFSGLLAVGVGIFGLVTVRRAGVRALHSREALLQGFQKGLDKLPWIIGIIGFFTALGLACAVGFELARYAGDGARVSGRLIAMGVAFAGLLFVFGVKLVYNIYKASKVIFERAPMRLMGKNASQSDAPKLWAFVREIAQKAGAAMPEAIVLGLDEGFFVTEHPVELLSGETVPEGRVLYLPLPYMAYMTQAEASAVIGHELGHFTGADTEYSLRFSPIYAAAVTSLRAVVMTADDGDAIAEMAAKPALMFGRYYLDSFDLAVQHWSREREFAADRMGAAIAGGDAVALSLLRISVLAPHVYSALAECWAKGGKLPGGVLHRVRELVREQGLSDPAEHLEEAQAHPTDSHPSTRRRLEAVGVTVTEDLLARARCTEESTLLRDLELEGDKAEAWEALRAPALAATLEAEFSNAARENAGEWETSLREAAVEGTEHVAIYESVRFMLCILCASIVIGFSVSGFLITDSGDFGAGALVAAVTLTAGYPLFRLAKRAKIPALTFTDGGFSVDGGQEIVPWEQVADYGISVGSTSFFETGITVSFLLEDGYEPETARTVRSRYKPKQQTIYVTLIGLAKPYGKAELLNEELFAHWRGGNARKVLTELEKTGHPNK
ncbi:MAG: Protease HtpX [Desulfovibrio sp.]